VSTVVIDPGHGGSDRGVRGPRGAEEKALTLAVAQRLKTLIETRLGARVVMTRADDRDVTLDTRAAIANSAKADLFVSLHFNAAPGTSSAGAEVAYLRLDRDGERARRAAASSVAVLPVTGGSTRTLEIVRWDLAQARHVDTSAVFAGFLEEQLRGRVAMGSHPRRDSPLRGLAGVDMPAALVELAYLTNPDQETLAQSEAFQADVAQAIADAALQLRASFEGRETPARP
jgi:N-acetylmuramoyl-L-alanine amidase